MTLTVYFYDKGGTSLASPAHLTSPDPLLAYADVVKLRDALVKQRGVRVLLHTVES